MFMPENPARDARLKILWSGSNTIVQVTRTASVLPKSLEERKLENYHKNYDYHKLAIPRGLGGSAPGRGARGGDASCRRVARPTPRASPRPLFSD